MKQEGKTENKEANQENGKDSHQFEPHQFKSSQCAKCFRSLAEHRGSMDSEDKGLVGKVINLQTFGVHNGNLESQPGTEASGSSASGSDNAQTFGQPHMQPNISNNLSADHSFQKGSRLKRQVPISKEQGATLKNNLSSPKRTNNSPGQQENITTGERSTADDSCSENGSVTDNTAVQLVAYKLKSVNNLGSASQISQSSAVGKPDFSKKKSSSRTVESKVEIRTKNAQRVPIKSQNGPTSLSKPKGKSSPALRNGTNALNSDKKSKAAVASSVTVTLKKPSPSKSGIPLRKSADRDSDTEIQRIAKNLRPVHKTSSNTVKVENKLVVPKLNKSIDAKPTEEEIVDVEERNKIIESKSSFASETLSKTAFTVFSGGHKHDTLPKRLREPQSRPSVKPLKKEDRNNSDPELFHSVQSEEVKVVSVSGSDSIYGDVTSHSQAVTSSEISSEIYFGKSPKKSSAESDQNALLKSISGTPGNVVIVDAAGNVSHFNTKSSVGSENAESPKSSISTGKPLPKEKAPASFTIPYRVVDLDESSQCRPYRVVDIVSNPPSAHPDELDTTINPPSLSTSQLPGTSTHRDTPTKFPKPSFSFPSSTNTTSPFQTSISPPPFPVILHDEKVTSPKEKGYENPSKVAIYIGSGGYDNLPEPGRAPQEEEDDDLDDAIAVVAGYCNNDQMMANSSQETLKEPSQNTQQEVIQSAAEVETISASENTQAETSERGAETENAEGTNVAVENAGMNITEIKERERKESGNKTSDEIVRDIDNDEQNRTKDTSKGDTLTMGYERPVNILPLDKSNMSEYMRQRSLSDPEIISPMSSEYVTLALPTSPKATSDQSLNQIVDDTDDLPPSPRRRTSSMPDYAKKKALGHRRERSKTVEVVPTISVETKSEQKIKPKRVAPPPPPPPPTGQNRPASPPRIPEVQRRSRALSPSREDTRTKAPPRHEEATADSMPRYPPPPPPPQSSKKMISPPSKGAQSAVSPARAMSPPIAISRPPEDPPRITNTPPKDEWIKPTPVMMESPQQMSSSPPRADTKMKLPKFSLRKLLVGKKREPEPPGSPTRPVNAEVVQRWLNKQSYLSGDEMASLEVQDIPSDPERSIISVTESLTSADGLNKAIINKLEQDLAKKRRAPRKPPPPPVPAGEHVNSQPGAPEQKEQVTPTNSPQLQKAYSLSPPSMRRLQEQENQENGVDYQNTGAARAKALSPKKPTRRERRGRNKTTGFEDLPSRRQAPAPPGHSHTNHIYDEIPYDRKRQAPMPPGDRSLKSAPAKPPRKLSFDDRLPVPAPRHKTSNERINEMEDTEMHHDVEEIFLFEETEKETHLKSALKHAQPDKIDGNRAPRRPVRILAPEEEGHQNESPEEGIVDPSYANLYTMLKQAAELAKRQGEQKRWSSSSDDTIDSQRGAGKRPIPTPRVPVKINRSTSPIMFPGNVRDKASVFEPSTDSGASTSHQSLDEPPEPAKSGGSQTAELETNRQEERLNELNLNTLKRMMTMWKVQQEEHFTLNEVSWNDLILKTEVPRFASSDTIIYPVMHSVHQNQPLAAQICIKPENKDRFLEGMQVCRSIVPHPNVFQVTSVFTDNIPESVLGLEPVSPKMVTEDEPGTSSPVEKLIEASVVLTSREPTTQADMYIKHSKEMHEFLPEKYEHGVCLLLLQLFQGLHHLDMHHIVHRDLKTENLFLASSRLPGGGTQLMIANFESAKEKTEENPESGSGSKTQEFEAGLMIYEFLHEKSPFVVKTLLITQDYSPSDLPALQQLSTYSQGLNKIAGELLRRHPSDRLSTEKAISTLQCLLWGPPGTLLQDISDGALQERELKNWLDLERAKAVNTVAEKHIATLLRGEQGISLEDHLHCQFLSEMSVSVLRESYKLLND